MSNTQQEGRLRPIRERIREYIKGNDGMTFAIGAVSRDFDCPQNSIYVPLKELEREGLLKVNKGKSSFTVSDFYPGKSYQRLFDVINESAPNPLLSQMHDIIQVVHKDFPETTAPSSPLTVDELKQKFAHYIGGENYTYDQLDTREQDTLEWVLKNINQ